MEESPVARYIIHPSVARDQTAKQVTQLKAPSTPIIGSCTDNTFEIILDQYQLKEISWLNICNLAEEWSDKDGSSEAMDGVDAVVNGEVLLVPPKLPPHEQVEIALVEKVVNEKGQKAPEDHPPSETLPWSCQSCQYCHWVLFLQNFQKCLPFFLLIFCSRQCFFECKHYIECPRKGKEAREGKDWIVSREEEEPGPDEVAKRFGEHHDGIKDGDPGRARLLAGHIGLVGGKISWKGRCSKIPGR